MESHRKTNRTRLRIPASIIAAAIASCATVAAAGSFSVLSYNVRGLPQVPDFTGDRSHDMKLIAPLLEDYHRPAPPYVGMAAFVGLQEVFDRKYYNILTNPQVVTYAYITPKDTSGPTDIGDGLTLLSDFRLDFFARIPWDDCHGSLGSDGSDCDANKGFTFARMRVDSGVSIDVYTLHADAGQDNASRTVRRKNITQLTQAIRDVSPAGTAVIVLGDTNSHYTRVGFDNIQDLIDGTGVSDVWVELRRQGVVPGAGPDIDAGCDADPGSADCELVDKVFYRSGGNLVLTPRSYAALKQMFSDADGELSDHTPVTVTFEYALGNVTSTTTTTLDSPTSTTMPELPCGDPVEPGEISASDALFILKVAVSGDGCAPCTCDVDSSGSISASDSLRVLKIAVGQDATLNCPDCG